MQSKEKLQIQTTVQVYDTVNLDIELPYYCKTSDGAYHKIITPRKALRLTDHSLIIVNPQHSHTAKEIAASTVVTENEFDVMAYAIISDAEEIIKEKPSRYNDVNEEIDDMREREMERRQAI